MHREILCKDALYTVLDLGQAFDLVNYSLLLEKLEMLGFRGT